MLEKIGYSVTGINNPVAALAQIETDPEKFALLITDLTMPGMTGIDLATEVHRLRPTLPAIVITGDTSLLDPEPLKAIGIREIIAKPFAVRILADAIRKSLGS